MAPVSQSPNITAGPTAFTTTYLHIECNPIPRSYDCIFNTLYNTDAASGTGWTAMAEYMEASWTTSTESGNEFLTLEMQWRTTPLSIVNSWGDLISSGKPPYFDEPQLATDLYTASITPDWVLKMPPDARTYYLSASLAIYTTPIDYYRLIVSTAGLPEASASAGIGATPGATLSSTQGSDTTIGTTASNTKASTSTGLPSSATSPATPSETVDPRVITPGQAAAISISVIVVGLAIVSWLIFYHKRIRSARKRTPSESPQPPPRVQLDDSDAKHLALPVPAVQRSRSKKKQTNKGPTTTAPASIRMPLSELDGTSAIPFARTHGYRYHTSAELEGSPATNTTDTGFGVDAECQPPPRADQNST